MAGILGRTRAHRHSAGRDIQLLGPLDGTRGARRGGSAVFGPDRVTVSERLDDAIELGVALADEADAAGEGGPGKAGVLITGSVIYRGRCAGAAWFRPGRERGSAVLNLAGHPGGSARGIRVKRLCATVLIMEAIIVGLSIPVAVQIDHLCRAYGRADRRCGGGRRGPVRGARAPFPAGHADRREPAAGVRYRSQALWCL